MGSAEGPLISPRLRPSELKYNWRWPKYDFAYIGVPKCGSVTMREAFGCRDGLPRKEVMGCKHRWAVIRDPVKRIVSAHGYGWPGIPFEVWWEEVKKNPSFDVHTRPYADYLGKDPTRIVCLEDINLWWPDLQKHYPVPQNPPHANMRRTDHANITAHQVWEICQVYRKDLLLWERSRHCSLAGDVL